MQQYPTAELSHNNIADIPAASENQYNELSQLADINTAYTSSIKVNQIPQEQIPTTPPAPPSENEQKNFVTANDVAVKMTDQQPPSSTLNLKRILKITQSAATPSIDQLSYAEYDALKQELNFPMKWRPYSLLWQNISTIHLTQQTSNT